MEVAVPKTYDLAVVFDDLPSDFDAACDELVRLHKRLLAVLRQIDLAYLPPTTLICRLAFDPSFVGAGHISDRLSVAQTRHFRVLDLMVTSGEQPIGVFERQIAVAAWCRVSVVDLTADLHDLRRVLGARLDGPERRLEDRTMLVMPVRFTGGTEVGLGLTRNLSSGGMYVESDVLPPVGCRVTMELESLKSTEIASLSATVADRFPHEQARQAGRVPGFGVQFNISAGERRLLDSFLVTAIQGRPWPERSGRRYGRFPIRLTVRWQNGEAESTGETINISRGGALIRTDAAVGPGTMLSLTVCGFERTAHTELGVRVVHSSEVRDPARGETYHALGVAFVDSEDEITKKLVLVLGDHQVPVVHRALLIDDDRFFADLLTGSLRHNAYHVRYEQSCELGIKRLAEELFHFDVVILDLHLPGMSGRAFLDWLHKSDASRDITVVVVTASKLSAVKKAELVALGAAQVFSKDVSPQVIVKTIDGVLARKAFKGF